MYKRQLSLGSRTLLIVKLVLYLSFILTYKNAEILSISIIIQISITVTVDILIGVHRGMMNLYNIQHFNIKIAEEGQMCMHIFLRIVQVFKLTTVTGCSPSS